MKRVLSRYDGRRGDQFLPSQFRNAESLGFVTEAYERGLWDSGLPLGKRAPSSKGIDHLRKEYVAHSKISEKIG